MVFLLGGVVGAHTTHNDFLDYEKLIQIKHDNEILLLIDDFSILCLRAALDNRFIAMAFILKCFMISDFNSKETTKLH